MPNPLIRRRSGFDPLFGNSYSLYQRILATRPSNLIAYYPLNDLSGTVITDLVGRPANVMTNGGFDQVYANVVVDFYNMVAGTAGTIAQDATVVHRGKYSIKLTNGSTPNGGNIWHPFLTGYDTPLTPGVTYTWKFWTKGDGTNQGQYKVRDVTHSTDLIAATNTGVTGDWAQVTGTFTVPAGCIRVDTYLYGGAANGAVVYFDNCELIPTGVITTNAALVGSGATLGVPGIGDGLTAIRLGGAAYINLFVPSFLYSLNFDEGSALIWWRYNSADDWPGGSTYEQVLLSLNTFPVIGDGGATDKIFLWKDTEGSPTQGPLHHSYKYVVVGQGDTQHIEPVYAEDLLWHAESITWSKANSRIRIYHDGSYPATYLPAYPGPEDVIETVMRGYPFVAGTIGMQSDSVGSRYWRGDLAHCALWDTEISPDEALNVSKR